VPLFHVRQALLLGTYSDSESTTNKIQTARASLRRDDAEQLPATENDVMFAAVIDWSFAARSKDCSAPSLIVNSVVAKWNSVVAKWNDQPQLILLTEEGPADTRACKNTCRVKCEVGFATEEPPKTDEDADPIACADHDHAGPSTRP
jgi:hypothetical protein